MRLWWLAAVPPTIFLFCTGLAFFARFCAAADSWWAFPLWMSLGMPGVLAGILLVMLETALAFGAAIHG